METLMLAPKTVSAVIPFYNAAGTLKRALTSIERQSHPVLETIVVNDGSSPEQTAMALSIVEEFSTTTRILHLEHNRGPSAARNLGVRAARGAYVAFLDADDYWLSGKLGQVLSVMSRSNLDFLGHNNIVCGAAKPSFNDRLHPFAALYKMNQLDILVSTSQFAPSTVVFRKGEVPVEFDESIRYSEDYRLWGELVFRGYKLWKLKAFLSAREEPHIKGAGLSGSVDRQLAAHIATCGYFTRKGFVSAPLGRAAELFLKLKYARHR